MNNNYIKVKIEGRNVNNYIKWLIKKKINIINLNIIKDHELEVILDYHDYPLLSEYSKTYNITVVKKYGKLRLIDIFSKNIIMLACLIFSIIFVYSLSSIIFSVDIIYNDKEIVTLINNELSKYDIRKFRKKKSYHYLNEVKNKILTDNNDTLEWLEIEESGTKYIVRVVERKKERTKEEYLYQSIVAKKNATIVSINANAGEKVKNDNEYVKCGDTIITGILAKTDGTNIYIKAQGRVLGEVWYKADVEYPLYYQEEKLTGKRKNVFSIYFLNKEIPIFSYKRYKQFKKQQNIFFENNFLPIKLVKEKLYEVDVKEDIYTPEEAITKATAEVKKKLIVNNSNIVRINDVIILDKQILNSRVKLNLFISVVEDITEIVEVKPESNKEIIDKILN